MTRQTRRRLAMAGAAAVLGIGSPFWGPALLRTVPAFNVAGIDVAGARYVPADAARALAGILPDASAWDDHSEAEARLETHPLVEEARVVRQGFNRLSIELREVRPVALVSAPALEPGTCGQGGQQATAIGRHRRRQVVNMMTEIETGKGRNAGAAHPHGGQRGHPRQVPARFNTGWRHC